jgi:predicted O-methyltransferase YrrM
MSVTLKKILRLLGTNSPRTILSRGAAALQGWRRIRRIAREKRTFSNVDDLLDFIFGRDASFIRPSQIRDEIRALLCLVKSIQPKTMMEIGTNNGGTLFLWTRVAQEDAEIISLDLPNGEFGGGYPRWKRPLYTSFALPRQRIHLLQADSHRETSLQATRKLLRGKKLDYLLIDGDHTYEGVKRDFEMYAPLVRAGGVIAFHDIVEHSFATCQVDRFWREIKSRFPSQEFVAIPRVNWAGIGVINWPGQPSSGSNVSACPS